jgi:5-methylcytosine-specific restriction enzyme subunit McrC
MEPRVLELREYDPVRLPKEELAEELGIALLKRFDKQLTVDFPTPKTDGQWVLTSQGWVGTIPLTADLRIALKPKVPLGNLFRMLEYAYHLRSLAFLEGLTDCASLTEYFERLANVLARRVLDRGRKGFYRTYEPEDDRLPVVRGRLDVMQRARSPWDAKLLCHYHEHTSDTAENQLLAWTLLCIGRSGVCTERTLPTVRRAFRGLQGFAAAIPFTPRDCVGRLYNRLNEDYQPMHALCRFFLEHSGPLIEAGEHRMLPFLVDMERLYEVFVAEWLRLHLPNSLRLETQYAESVGPGSPLSLKMDIVIVDAVTGAVRHVLDTKYKTPDHPSGEDFSQVHTYASLKGCHEAVLVYPTELARPLDETPSGIRVRSLSFVLDGDIEERGRSLLSGLMS